MKDRFKKCLLNNWCIFIILILATILYSWKIWDAGEANSFYTSAIVSMTQSLHNFWFASFDPAGYITVDKPPIALWFMAISGKIFGIHGWSIVLPSVLFGIGSVALVYILTKRHFGKLSGCLASLAMTFTPIVVADSRTNNMDATLIFFLLLAFYILDTAIQKHKVWLTIVSFSIIGISFNIKMLQAFMVLPAMILFYWLASHRRAWPKIKILSFSMVALALFTLIWPLSVDLTPASNRPYEGGSQHNSVLELAFGYNGAQRLLGQSGGGNNPTKSKQKPMSPKVHKMRPRHQNHLNKPNKPHMSPHHSPAKMGHHPSQPNQNSSASAAKNGGGGAFDIGTRGPLRLFQSQLGPQVSWLLIFALLGTISSFIYYQSDNKKKKWYQLTSKQKELILWCGWLLPVMCFFSIANFFHPYYMIMLAPPISVLFGVGLKTMYRQIKDNGYHSYKSYILPVAFLATLGLEAWYTSASYIWLSYSLIILGIILMTVLIILANQHRKIFKSLLIMMLALVLIAPAWWSLTPTITGSSLGIPTAGPALLSSHNNQQAPGGNLNHQMLNYLEKHDGHAKFLFATNDSNTASPYIIKTHRAVMAMGGFTGNDPSMKLSHFKQLVKKGEVKYYLSSDQDSANQSTVNWIKKHGHKIKASVYGDKRHNSHAGPNHNNNLYRL